MVRESHVTLPGGDRFEDFCVAVDDGRLVLGPAAHDRLGVGLAVAAGQRGDQRLVVDVARRAQAEAAFPLWVAERLVGGELGRRDLLRVVHDGACAHGEADPAHLGIAQVRGEVGLKLRRVHLLEQTRARGVPEVAGVDGQQHVGRRPVALGAQPLEHLTGAAVQDLDLDPGLLRERFERRLLAVVTRGVDDDLARLGRRR